jgi:hypothetical protein
MRGTRQVRRRYTSGPHATATVSGSRLRKWCMGVTGADVTELPVLAEQNDE